MLEQKSAQMFPKVAQTVATNYPKNYQSFGLLLLEFVWPRTFKNRPIWSHCLPHLKASAKTQLANVYAKHSPNKAFTEKC